MSSKRVIIFGAGFSGLCLGHFLSRKGISVEIREKNEFSGGLLGSQRTEWGLVESAANGLLINDDLVDLCDELKLELIPALKINKKRYIYRDRLMSLPVQLKEWPGLLWFLLRYSFGMKSIRPLKKETLGEWAFRNFPYSFAESVVLTALQGIYGADTGKLSASLVLKPLFKKRNQAKKTSLKGTVSFKRGMGELIEALLRSVEKQGGRVRYNCTDTLIKENEIAVISTDLQSAKLLLEKLNSEISLRMKELSSSDIVSATCFFPSKASEPKGFGCLFPAQMKFNSMGVLFNSDIFPNRSSMRSETFIIPGKFINESEDEILKRILQDRERFFESSEVVGAKIFFWPNGLPNYDINLERFLEENIINKKSPYLLGNYLGEIGLAKILSRAKRLAKTIEENHS